MQLVRMMALVGVFGLSQVALAQDIVKLYEEFGRENLALDAEYRKGKQVCQQRHAFNTSPDRDSKKLTKCFVDFDEKFADRRCNFYVKWWHKTKAASPLVRPESFPQCASYFR